MHFVKKQASEKRQHFADQLKTGKLLRFPGAYNPLVAKLIEEIGYDGVYVSGWTIWPLKFSMPGQAGV